MLEALQPSVARDELFSIGNEKLGSRVLTFSLPAVITCPGSSDSCRDHCYADNRRSVFVCPSVQQRYQQNWEMSQRDDFHEMTIQLLKSSRHPLIRIHVSGDFYNDVYAWKWLQIVKATPHATFWVYTRSWVVPEILVHLRHMANLPNMHMWFSHDREMPRPRRIHPRIRWAYMMTDDNDLSPGTDLYFRTDNLRGTIAKNFNGTLVCPVENGVSHTVCEKCRICLTDPCKDPTKRTKR